MFEITLGVLFFTGIVLSLVGVILYARSHLIPSGDVIININGERDVPAKVGGKLLAALADANLFVSSACGGREATNTPGSTALASGAISVVVCSVACPPKPYYRALLVDVLLAFS